MRLYLALLPLVVTTLALNGQATSSQKCHQDNFCQCRDIILANGSELTSHQKSILQELCYAGHFHRKNKGKDDSEQFAMINIHNNIKSDKPQWNSGEAENVICNPEWLVDEVMPLRPGRNFSGAGAYKWYKHGISMWPILGQSLEHNFGHLKRPVSKNNEKWPNYAIATPLYRVQSECNLSGSPSIAMRKRFASPNTFPMLKTFKKFVEKIMTAFLDENKTECQEPIQMVNDYEKWLQPFMLESLKSMIMSVKKSNDNTCPYELYIFIRCDPREIQEDFAEKLLSDLNEILTEVKCLKKTNIVTGWLPNAKQPTHIGWLC